MTAIVLFASALLVSVDLALGCYLGLLIRELIADKGTLETSDGNED
jgi:hypothetical protein